MREVKEPEEETERLRFIVNAWCDGHIFSNVHLPSDDNIARHFMVLAMCKKEDIPSDAVIVYVYLDVASPRSVNGNPCFFSCRFLNKEQWDRVRAAVKLELERRKGIEV